MIKSFYAVMYYSLPTVNRIVHYSGLYGLM